MWLGMHMVSLPPAPGQGYLLLTTYYSRITTYYLLLTTHCSLLTTALLLTIALPPTAPGSLAAVEQALCEAAKQGHLQGTRRLLACLPRLTLHGLALE